MISLAAIEFGKKLEELRKQKGLSQSQLARQIGVDRAAVGRWECGYRLPSRSSLLKLKDIYKLDARAWLELTWLYFNA